MGKVWLANLPAVLRKAGLTVEEFEGWETRSRSTGGYEEVRGIGIHHDAISEGVPEINRSRAGWTSDWNTNKPVGAVRLNKNGTWVVGAAGATNTQGKGGPYATSKGTIPRDQGNLYVFSIEPSNNGVGEVWSLVQQESYVTGCAAVMLWLGLEPADIMAHFEWAPGRKADPAGPSQFTNGRNVMWDMGKFREAVRLRAIQLINEGKAWGIDPPTPPEGDQGMTDEQFEQMMAKLEEIRKDGYLVQVRMDYMTNKWSSPILAAVRSIDEGVRKLVAHFVPSPPEPPAED